MKIGPIFGMVLSTAFLTGCSSQDVDTNKNLRCAAMISASAFVITDGSSKSETSMLPKTVYAGQMYVNLYAHDTGQESRAVTPDVHQVRDTLVESLDPEKIVSRAKKCISRLPI